LAISMAHMLSQVDFERQKHAKKAEKIVEEARVEDICSTRAFPAIRKRGMRFDGMLQVFRRCPNIPW